MIPQELVDAIFVFAGRQSRKRFGLELYREGRARRLILSVGRFEWRRFAELGLPDDGGLLERVPEIEPAKRHFFVHVEKERTTCEAVFRGKLGTWSEARALARSVERDAIGKLIVVSHRPHLPRCRLALSALLPRKTAVETVSCPADRETEPDPSWWPELVKLPAYVALSGVARTRRRGRGPACTDRRFLL